MTEAVSYTHLEHALLGLGLMLSAGEIPRIAGAFGLDTSTRANLSLSLIHIFCRRSR